MAQQSLAGEFRVLLGFAAFAVAFSIGLYQPSLARNENPANPGLAAESATVTDKAVAPAPGAGAAAESATTGSHPTSVVAATEPSPPPGDAAEAPPEGEVAAEPVVLDGGISVAIGGDQRATVIGETPSLRGVVQEICRQARIDLRAYGAPDRRYVGKLENVPLADAFRSMLRSESYLVWLKEDPHGRGSLVKWMRVLGTDPTATRSMTAIAASPFAAPQPAAQTVPPPAVRFSLSTSLLFQAFGTFDPVRRDQAQREIIERISDPEQLQRFLQTDASLLVSLFNRYRDSELTLGRLKSLSAQPEVQAKFDEILNKMAETAATP